MVRRMYEAIPVFQPDLPSDEVLAYGFRSDVEIQQMDVVGTAGTFRGYEGVRQSSREILESFVDVQFEPLEHVASGDKVAFIVRITGRGRTSDVPVEAQVGHLFKFKDKLIARWVVYANPQEALEAVGQSE